MSSIPRFTCIDCGKPVKKPKAKRCADCWAKARAAQHFCEECGAPLTKSRTKRCMSCYLKSFDDPTGFKECNCCKQLKPLTAENFGRLSSSKDGYMPVCRDCKSQRAKTYYTKNKDRVNRKNRDWQLQNREVVRKVKQEYYLKHRDRILAKVKQAYLRDPESAKRRLREWAEKNPDRVRVGRRVRYQRWRTRMRMLPNTFKHQDWNKCLTWWNGCCAYCGAQQDFWNVIQMDHYIALNDPLSLGTTSINIVPACYFCNASKGDTPAKQWVTWKFGKHRARKILKRIEDYFAWVTEQNGGE